jgi:hypothetical protein
MPKNDDKSQTTRVSSRVEYKEGMAGGMYVVRRVESNVDAVENTLGRSAL